MSVTTQPVQPRRLRPTQLAAGLTMTAMVVLATGACSSDEPAPGPETTVSTTSSVGNSGTETSAGAPTGTTAASSRPSGTGTGTASTMTCAQFRELDDAERSAVLTELDVTANAHQVATVAATVCLSRPDDTIAAVVAELVPR